MLKIWEILNENIFTAFKVKIAPDLIKGVETMTAICSKFSIHPTQAPHWKEQALNLLQGRFDKKILPEQNCKKKEKLIEELYK
jgi:transposase-like protein